MRLDILLIPFRFGFDISSISAIIGTKQYVAYFNNPHGIVQGGIGAALAGGSVIGAIMAGPVSNRLGRRDAIFFACFWWLLGTALQTSCNGIGMLVAGRFINGICVGITSSQVPVYLVEVGRFRCRYFFPQPKGDQSRKLIYSIRNRIAYFHIFIRFRRRRREALSLSSNNGPSNGVFSSCILLDTAALLSLVQPPFGRRGASNLFRASSLCVVFPSFQGLRGGWRKLDAPKRQSRYLLVFRLVEMVRTFRTYSLPIRTEIRATSFVSVAMHLSDSSHDSKAVLVSDC